MGYFVQGSKAEQIPIDVKLKIINFRGGGTFNEGVKCGMWIELSDGFQIY